MPLKKLKIKTKALPEILEIDPTMTSTELIEKEVQEAFDLATQMLDKVVALFENITAQKTEAMVLFCWRDQKSILDFFGDYKLNTKQVEKVERRIKRVHRRVAKEKIKIQVESKTIFNSKYENSYALNFDFFLFRKSFRLLSKWFKYDKQVKANIIVKELFRDLFSDKKVEYYYGNKIKANGGHGARRLAQ